MEDDRPWEDYPPVEEPPFQWEADHRERQDFPIVYGNYAAVLVARRHVFTDDITLALWEIQ